MKMNYLIILFTFAILFIPQAYADGGIIRYDPSVHDWVFQDMSKQMCIIDYENNTEEMTLLISLKDWKKGKAAWIIPIPAEPEKTKIDIHWGLIRVPFNTENIRSYAKEVVKNMPYYLSGTQVYPFIYFIFIPQPVGALSSGVNVIETIEKGGIRAELITAEDSESIYRYLNENGVKLSPELKSKLDEYIGKKYCFVIAWVTDPQYFFSPISEIFFDRSVEGTGLLIKFPTNKIYFPLKLTSVYGNNTIPILIFVKRYVTPQVYEEIKDGTKIDYIVGDFSETKYTKIEINTPSLNFKDDLWMEPSPPIDIAVLDFISSPYFYLLTLILVSSISSVLAALIVFKNEYPDIKLFALLGLSNVLTFFSFIVASYLFRVDEKFVISKNKSTTKNPKERIILLLIIIIFVAGVLILFLTYNLLFGGILIFSSFLALFIFIFLYSRKIAKFCLVFTVLFNIIVFLTSWLIEFVI